MNIIHNKPSFSIHAFTYVLLTANALSSVQLYQFKFKYSISVDVLFILLRLSLLSFDRSRNRSMK